jgi:hypothetical protein
MKTVSRCWQVARCFTGLSLPPPPKTSVTDTETYWINILDFWHSLFANHKSNHSTMSSTNVFHALLTIPKVNNSSSLIHFSRVWYCPFTKARWHDYYFWGMKKSQEIHLGGSWFTNTQKNWHGSKLIPNLHVDKFIMIVKISWLIIFPKIIFKIVNMWF